MGALFAVSLSASACAVAGSSAEYPSATIRYKMTVEVETPEGIKTGSAVREISMVSRPMRMGEMNDTHMRLEKGEAVVVDLGQRGVLFATLGSATDPVWSLLNAFPSPCAEGAVSRCSVKYYSSLKPGDSAQLSTRYYPMFVAFGDLNDPKSAKNVLEMKSCPDPATGIPDNSRCIDKDHFEETFGRGVRLRFVVIEITKADIEFVVRKILPWLPNYYNKRLDGQRFSFANAVYKVANRLSSGSFSAGEKNDN
jgi:hypothetical protein